jgi:predicted dehydrogenase
MTPIRIGVLGAARIVPMALLNPAKSVPEVVISAVAARDASRATAFARKHGISRVLSSYAELVNDPNVDAIYNPLPNSLHCEWSIRALEAGKHVLCEKPIASNAEEAMRMAETAQRTKKILVEAFHWRYHPLADRLLEIVRSGRIGRVKHVEAKMCFPLLSRNDIRYNWSLSGGALMDAGCYTISMVRHLSGEEPEVTRAEARLASPKVDRFMQADLGFPSGVTGRITASMFSSSILAMSVRVQGDAGEVGVLNPVLPQFWHRLSLRTGDGRSTERVPGEATYTYQLRAFAGAIRAGTSVPTGPDDAIRNMRVIDAIYTKVGLPLRGTA